MSGYRHSGMCRTCFWDRETLKSAVEIIQERSERPLRSVTEHLEEWQDLIQDECDNEGCKRIQTPPA